MGFYDLNRQLGNWHSNILPSVTRKPTCYFPHSAAYPDSFAGLGFLSLYLCGKLHIFDHKGHVWKSLLVMIPIMGAILVAISRIMDYRHHPWDVIFGSLLGKWNNLHLWIWDSVFSVLHWAECYSGHGTHSYFLLDAACAFWICGWNHLILTRHRTSFCSLGFAAAYFSYHQYYPPLHAHDCHVPFEPRHHVKLIPDDSTEDTPNAEATTLDQNPVS